MTWERMKRQSSKDSLVSLILPLALILGLVLLLSLSAGQTNSEAATNSPLEAWLKLIVGYLAAGAEIQQGEQSRYPKQPIQPGVG